MKVVPIASYLSEFENGTSPEKVQIPDVDLVAENTVVDLQNGFNQSPAEIEDEPSQESLLQEQFEAGVKKRKKQAEIEFASRLEAQKKDLTNIFGQEIAKLQGDQAEQLGARLKTELSHVETTIANSVASIIKPFVSGVVQVRVLNELAVAIGDILTDPQSVQITIRGPKGLLDALAANLDPPPAAIVYVENDDLEICVEHGHEKIESRLQAWSDLIKSQLG